MSVSLFRVDALDRRRSGLWGLSRVFSAKPNCGFDEGNELHTNILLLGDAPLFENATSGALNFLVPLLTKEEEHS